MTHDPLSPKHVSREPLAPEEQALSRRLADIAPGAEPASSLDARVLAAARASTAASARPARRWPVALGVAASLVLALGIAWRLRPLPGPAGTDRPVAATPIAGGAIGNPASVSRPAAAEVVAAPAPPPREVAMPTPIAARPAPSRERATTETADAGIPAPEPSVVLAAPAPSPVADLPAPPPPVPAAQADASGAPARKAAATTSTEEDTFDAAAAADQAAGDEPESDVPPATADSPEVREAWLQRIRELVADGQVDAARASLKEFARRHPDTPLPDDLRALSP